MDVFRWPVRILVVLTALLCLGPGWVVPQRLGLPRRPRERLQQLKVFQDPPRILGVDRPEVPLRLLREEEPQAIHGPSGAA